MIFEQSKLQEAVKKIAPDVYHSMYKSVSGLNDGPPHEGWKVEAPKLSETYMGGLVRFTRSDEGGFKSQVFESPTWADVMRAMQASIEALDDYHHVFLEALVIQGSEVPKTCEHCGRGPTEDELPVLLVEMITGS